MSSTSNSLATLASDEFKLRSYRDQLEVRHEQALKDQEMKHAEEITELLTFQKNQKDQLEKDFDVQISSEAEQLQNQLYTIRNRNQASLEEEQQKGEIELNKAKTINQQRVEEYRKNSEAQLDALRKQLQASTEELHEKARRTAVVHSSKHT